MCVVYKAQRLEFLILPRNSQNSQNFRVQKIIHENSWLIHDNSCSKNKQASCFCVFCEFCGRKKFMKIHGQFTIIRVQKTSKRVVSVYSVNSVGEKIIRGSPFRAVKTGVLTSMRFAPSVAPPQENFRFLSLCSRLALSLLRQDRLRLGKAQENFRFLSLCSRLALSLHTI